MGMLPSSRSKNTRIEREPLPVNMALGTLHSFSRSIQKGQCPIHLRASLEISVGAFLGIEGEYPTEYISSKWDRFILQVNS